MLSQIKIVDSSSTNTFLLDYSATVISIFPLSRAIRVRGRLQAAAGRRGGRLVCVYSSFFEAHCEINFYPYADSYSELEEVWDESEEEVNHDIEPPSIEVHESPSCGDRQQSMLAQWIIFFVAYLRAFHSLSDTVAELTLKFLATLFGVLGQVSSTCSVIAQILPRSLYKLKHQLGCVRDRFHRYVVCRRCQHIYSIAQCIHSNQTSKTCPHRPFPNHPHSRQRRECGTLLLKSVELTSGKKLLYPFLVYCYMSIENSLQELLLRPTFISECEQWRSRQVKPGVLEDIFDGAVWKDFQTYEGTPFLSEPLTFGLMINLDWFQPFKHSKYSIGAIYMTVMNLPRSARYKPENVMLVGILPGPSEPSDINSFLDPLVNELNAFWQGKELHVHGETSKKVIRCALLCASCDLPAGRKLCGFLSYNAHYGCSRCLKFFSGTAGEMDYSGFDRDNWPKRTVAQHRMVASEIQKCNTKSSIAAKESGYRYTKLLELPYFSPSRMLAIDPMHNLYLGTGKHILKDIWSDGGLIPESKFEQIQGRIDRMVVPPDIGRIPNKIKSGFSKFTADQLKNWIVYFSIIALKDVLNGADLECWRHFVLACRLLSSKVLESTEIQLADALLMRFCKRVQQMYGKKIITPNMHMHAHPCECIMDFGPSHSFWLFAFERYNGLMGKQPNNNRSIEVQFMQRFLDNHKPIVVPAEHEKEFSHLFSGQRIVGTLKYCLKHSLSHLGAYVHLTNGP